MASWNSGLKRDGPGLLLRDILRGEDPQVITAARLIAAANADLLVLVNVDFDYNLAAANALNDVLAKSGVHYPYLFAQLPNSGAPTGLDIDQDGYLGDARDAQGYGAFHGQGGMLVLSRFPIQARTVQSYTDLLWRDLPGHLMQSDELSRAGSVQRLSSVGHWNVPILLPGGRRLNLLAWHATTPVFDGPEDRNGRRNHDETRFWSVFLDGLLPYAPPDGSFVIAGSANIDPHDGEGRPDALHNLLADPRVQDPRPAAAQAGALGLSPGHLGDPLMDTADWREDGGPGNLRVQYVLPSDDLIVTGSGVLWPRADTPEAKELSARDPKPSRHGLVWVDIRW